MPNYLVSLTVSSRDPPFPCDKIVSTPNFVVECSKGVIKTITVKNIVADNTQSAIQLASSRLGAVMGFIALRTGRILDHHERRISITDDKGNTIVSDSSSPKSDTIQARSFGPPVNVDLVGFAVSRVRDPKSESALNLYYLASSLEYNQNIAVAFLNMFLAFETLVDGNALSQSQLKFRHIRHSIVHTDSGDTDARSFLMAEFGSHHPDWRAPDIQAKLLKWYDALEGEVVQLLNTKLT